MIILLYDVKDRKNEKTLDNSINIIILQLIAIKFLIFFI